MIQVYCKWVDACVERSKLSPMCDPHIYPVEQPPNNVKLVCYNCELSPQIALGVPVDRLLENLKGSEEE